MEANKSSNIYISPRRFNVLKRYDNTQFALRIPNWIPSAHSIFFAFTFTYPLTARVVGHHRRLHNQFPPFLSAIHFSLFPTALWDLADSRPVHFLMLSSNFFFCVPCLLPAFTGPCKLVFAKPNEQIETCSNHFTWHLFTMVGKSSCGSTACWILAQTSSRPYKDHVNMKCVVSCGRNLIFMACILPCSSTVMVHDS